MCKVWVKILLKKWVMGGKSIGVNLVKSMGEKSMGENCVKSMGVKRWVKKVWVNLLKSMDENFANSKGEKDG